MAASSQKRNNTKIYVSLGVAILIVGGLSAIWSFSILGRAPSRLADELKAAHADGLPVTPDQLREQMPVDENDNAAPFLGLAISQLKAWRSTKDGRDYSRHVGSNNRLAELKPADLDAIEVDLKSLSPMFVLLRQAASKPKLDFHRAWEKGPALMLPELSEEKACSTAAVLQGKCALRKGDVSSAIDFFDLAAKISRLTGQEPLIIGLLVQAAIRTQVIQAVETVVKTHGNDLAVLEQCKSVLKDLGPKPNPLPAMRSEFVMGRIAIKMMATSRPEVFGADSNNGVIRLARFGPVRTMFEWRYAQFYRQMYKDLAKSGDSTLQIQKSFLDAQNVLAEHEGKDWSYALISLLSPVFTGLGSAIGESEARRNVLNSSIELLEQKQRTGSLPSTIADKTGFWLDPFTDKPLTYKPSNHGFLIYSFARDGKDNGGKARDRNAGDTPYDIPFSYP